MMFKNLRFDMKRNKFLVFLCVPAVIWFCIFAYAPLCGLVVAFQKYSPARGIWGSEFVGLKNFKFFFGSQSFFQVTFNTLFLNALFIIATMVSSILIALAISEVSNRWFKKVSQSVILLPHFISWTVVALLMEAFIKTDGGIVNKLLLSLGLDVIPFYQSPKVWPFLLTLLRVWQGAGYGSIVYLAAITGLDQEMYEAARVDGASRFQRIRYLTLPLLKTTAILLFIMSVGKIFNGDFGMIYTLVGNNSVLYPTTDVIDTYVYRQLVEANNMGMSSAVGLYQSIMGFIMVMITNYITKKADPESALF
ncbi:ABC transporter permease [Lacrimispora sp. JR3]|uniref:ABC transporter permease n=1 Tax=Lacrimispora sinapis TaxID=3111456 RepID=UPI00374A12D4